MSPVLELEKYEIISKREKEISKNFHPRDGITQ